jgi:hypothetical protein
MVCQRLWSLSGLLRKTHTSLTSTEGTTAIEALEQGLDNLMELCDVVGEKFEAARAAHGKDGVDQ